MPTAEQTVDIQGETVAYQVRRSEQASQIRIDADLEGITLIVPEGRDVDPDALLQEKGDWILKQKDRFARHRAQMPERQFEEGETFPVLGTERTVVVQDVPASCVEAEEIRLAASKVEATSLKAELERIYRAQARRHFIERADHFCEVLGVSYEQIQIRNQKTRWGSYSQRTGTLSLNFRLLMAPPDIVDYVMVHELAHAEHPNHGARFWRFVEQHVPDYEAKDEWLKENGTRLIFDGSSI
jgi:predicted metal-dependent hydrolase